MLAAGLPIRCAAISAPGSFDTHDNQAESFESDTKLAADSIAAFQADLEARGLADRVITLVWSEFGRRPKENDSGTDHGAGGVAFVIGTRVKGRMVGEFPGLAQLDADDNLLVTADFRGLYCSMIEQWFGVDAAAVIPDAGLRASAADRLMATRAGSPDACLLWAPAACPRATPRSGFPIGSWLAARSSTSCSRSKRSPGRGDRPVRQRRRGPPRPAVAAHRTAARRARSRRRRDRAGEFADSTRTYARRSR